MPTEKLTAKRVEAFKPDPGRDRTDLFDAITPGLSLRITKNGSKSWVVNYRSPVERDRRGLAKVKRFTFGKFPHLSLVDARREASTIMRNIAEGHDPLQERTDARVVEARHGADPVTVQEGVARYVQEHVKVRNKSRTRADGTDSWERENLLRRHVISQIGGMAIRDVTRKHVLAMHRRIEMTSGATTADRAAEALRATFNWLDDTELVEDVPIIRLKAKAPRSETARHRLLSSDELRLLWTHLDESSPFGDIVRLLILTGQRRSEVAAMRWDEIKGEQWELPPERTKNKLPHIVPLSPSVLAIVERREQLGEFVFTTTGTSPFSGFSRSKERLDGRLGFTDWILHDLRRTFVTRLNELGIPPHVVEACVNHVSGVAKAGVAGVYNKAEYLPERRAAMERWTTVLQGIVAGKEGHSNLVQLDVRT
jgi:integrase